MSEIVNLYFSAKSSMNYPFTDGTVAHFVDGKYYTANEKHIAELNKEIANGNPFMFVKKDQLQVEKRLLDPMEALKEKIRAELKAEMAAGPTQMDLGTTAKPDVLANVATSQTIAASKLKVNVVAPPKTA